jgi:hypothetical protein
VHRRWAPTLAVAAVILSLTVGAHAATDLLDGPPASRIDVAGLVSVLPAPGWEPVSRRDDQGLHDVVFARGSARLLVVVLEGFADAPAALAEAYVEDAMRGRFVQVRLAPSPDRTTVVGREAVRLGYVGITEDRVFVEGGVTAVVGSTGAGVVFDAFAPEGTLAASADDLRRMMDGAEVA